MGRFRKFTLCQIVPPRLGLQVNSDGCSDPRPSLRCDLGFHVAPRLGLKRVKGYRSNSGLFQFGYVKGDIDYRPGIRERKPSVEFSWDGHNRFGADAHLFLNQLSINTLNKE